MRKVACHAVLGDGTINIYRGPVGPETIKAVKAINDWEPGMMELDPSYETIDSGYECTEPCESDEDLAETLLWWANSGEEREDWEVDTGVHHNL